MARRVNVFVSYSHDDEPLRIELGKHLSSLRKNKIADWHDRKIPPGAEWAKEIDDKLNSADVILLLISASFIHSDYCSGIELKRAMERHEAGDACVIPIILRPCDWQEESFAKLQAYPKNAEPVTIANNRDLAFLDIVKGIREAVDRLAQRSLEVPTAAEIDQETEALTTEIKESGKGEEQYRDEVLFCLKQDGGELSKLSRVILKGVQEGLELSSDRAMQIEVVVSRPFKIFRKAVIDLNVRSITPAIQARLDRLQESLKLSNEDARAIVEDVLSSTEPSAPPEPVITVPSKPSLPTFSFEIITVNDRGQEIDRRSGQASYHREELEKGVFLDMVSIPGGTFWMGAAEGELEALEDEKPRHQVMIAPFFIGKFAVTQAQWKAIAKLPKINRDLKLDPSLFNGNHRPVENVSWDEVIEFCDRLNRKTGEQYRLPSEAEWEYACRAGTATPFHFGETITPDLVNYDGTHTYANAPRGTYRRETIEVGSLQRSNAFGLYDMHGNVWEWCADPWHDSYINAPTDGRVWEMESDRENNLRVIRGGSWNLIPRGCRSAFRSGSGRDNFDMRWGFRLVLFRPKTS